MQNIGIYIQTLELSELLEGILNWTPGAFLESDPLNITDLELTSTDCACGLRDSSSSGSSRVERPDKALMNQCRDTCVDIKLKFTQPPRA